MLHDQDYSDMEDDEVLEAIQDLAPAVDVNMILEAEKRWLNLYKVFDVLGEFEDESDIKLTALQRGFAEEIQRLFQGHYNFLNGEAQKVRIDLSQVNIQFTNEKNKDEYAAIVLGWLESDFERRQKPRGHFWNNAQQIQGAFTKCEGLVALSDQGELMGFMTWSYALDKPNAVIDMVEVKEEYRRQGIFKKMLTSFCMHFPEVCILIAYPIPQSEKIFMASGWEKTRSDGCIKVVKPGLSPSDTLPDGQVLAICSRSEFYDVSKNLEKYKSAMKYFKINMDDHGKLMEPIITRYSRDSYIGVYMNKQLLAQHKADYLLSNTSYFGFDDYSSPKGGCLIINKIIPSDLASIPETFFMASQEERTHIESLPTDSGLALTVDSLSSPAIKTPMELLEASELSGELGSERSAKRQKLSENRLQPEESAVQPMPSAVTSPALTPMYYNRALKPDQSKADVPKSAFSLKQKRM